jgi:hypothetical protein
MSDHIVMSRRVDSEQGIFILSYPRDGEKRSQSPLSEEARAFLEKYVPFAVLEAFPEWQGILLESNALGVPLWVVRTRQDGRQLTEKTGQPAILLDDMLVQRGKDPEETRKALSPLLIVSPRREEGG